MKFSLHCLPGLNRFFHSRMISTMEFPLKSKIGSPFTAKLMKFDPSMSTFVSTTNTSILSIFRVSAFAKIFNFVIGTISVNMVNTVTRPNAMVVKPSESMGKVILAIDNDSNVSIGSFAARFITWFNFTTTSGYFPVKMAVCIRKGLEKFIMCNHTTIYQHDTLIVKNKGAFSAFHL